MLHKFKGLILGIITFFVLSSQPIEAGSCPQKHPNYFTYQRRDQNRCEGLLESRHTVEKLDLIGFSTGTISKYSQYLNIRIPGTGDLIPKLTLRSLANNYLLNDVKWQASEQDFRFRLPTDTVLRKAKIPPQSLRGNALIWKQYRPIYFPVVFGEPTAYYDITVMSSENTQIKLAQIRHEGKPLPDALKRVSSSPTGETTFRWHYKNAVGGLYELYLKDQQNNVYSFYLGHNPDWFKVFRP